MRRLRLPQVDRVWISGVDGRPVAAAVYAARVQLVGRGFLGRVVAFGDDAVIGRDLLNLGVVDLNGPRLALTAQWPSGR